MKYIVIFQLIFSTLFAHGKEHEHLHFFSSLHAEYFVFFIVGLVGAYFVYDKFFKDNR
ncbi:MAG: hypothetical protein PHQ93_09600 [Sulfurimonas sp.]|uniref:hypothetical protein n=1 Tax=Sulfurimonas sp. TaxID=2022749 RepID=UPI00263825F5|nr:hypothetical protein [Sulfurimonas sp.]MDD5401428.1 hypothetical protein [Sulfurimonas sp.]